MGVSDLLMIGGGIVIGLIVMFVIAMNAKPTLPW